MKAKAATVIPMKVGTSRPRRRRMNASMMLKSRRAGFAKRGGCPSYGR
jgi:hypothetical protein